MEKNRNYYKSLIKEKNDYLYRLKTFLEAFFFGGIVSILGQFVYDIYLNLLDEARARTLLAMTFIFIAGITTSLGVYDSVGQIAKCGLAIPITGFSNACIASSMEYHKEGITLGVASNCLKLAGSVIVLGSVAAIIVTFLRVLVGMLL